MYRLMHRESNLIGKVKKMEEQTISKVHRRRQQEKQGVDEAERTLKRRKFKAVYDNEWEQAR